MSPTDRVVVVLAILLAAVLPLAGSAHAAKDKVTANSCVQCHSGLPAGSFPGLKFHGWAGSVHQKHGVTCDKCHGGNPKAATKKEAHAGVYGSANPESRVYFKNIPSTCGECHGAEFFKFSQSLHYKMLESTGRGPECVTCHGSMVTHILSPENLATVCDRCHNERMGIRPYIPQKAKAVLLLLRESQALLEATEALHPPAKSSGAAEQIRSARASLHSAKLEWHRFDLDTITGYLEEMYYSLEKLGNSKCEKDKGAFHDQPQDTGSNNRR